MLSLATCLLSYRLRLMLSGRRTRLLSRLCRNRSWCMSHHPDIAFASNVIFDHPLWSIATLAARSEISVWLTWSRSFCETSVRAALLCASQRLCSFIVPCTESVPCQVAGSLGLRGHSEVSIRAPGIERSGLCLDNSWYSWRIVWNSAAPCLLLR